MVPYRVFISIKGNRCGMTMIIICLLKPWYTAHQLLLLFMFTVHKLLSNPVTPTLRLTNIHNHQKQANIQIKNINTCFSKAFQVEVSSYKSFMLFFQLSFLNLKENQNANTKKLSYWEWGLESLKFNKRQPVQFQNLPPLTLRYQSIQRCV